MIDLHIEKLTHGGRGMGRSDGKAVFVPLTCPGDQVRCRITRDKGRFAEAEMVDLLVPSPQRREPPCPLFGECGGCQWQHMPYPVQAEWKTQIFREMMTRQKVTGPERIGDILAAPDEFAYRSRVQFKCHTTPDGVAIGFYRTGSHYVVDAARCLLIAEPIQEALDRLRPVLSSAPCSEAVPQVDIGCDATGAVEVVVHVLSDAVSEMHSWLETLPDRIGCRIFLQSGRKSTLQTIRGPAGLVQDVGSGSVRLIAEPGCFTQVNPVQNSRMVEHVQALAALQGQERVLDLFCGIGNFSLPLARMAREVVGVEDYAPSIACARQNAVMNGLDNVRFLSEDAQVALQSRHLEGAFDLVLVDPPRSGCYDVMKELVRVMPGQILYVSCDPATLVRDLTLLVNNGYAVVQSRAIDMFPQTWHLESVTLLRRSA